MLSAGVVPDAELSLVHVDYANGRKDAPFRVLDCVNGGRLDAVRRCRGALIVEESAVVLL